MSNKDFCINSCTCVKSSCLQKHYVKDLSLRKTAKSYFIDNFIPSEHTENICKYYRNCDKGMFCLDKSCRKKHYCNLKFRIETYDLWKNFEKNLTTMIEIKKE